ncbi:MAG: OmpA family protein, partial [Psychrosphaera sp.]|nr:OmpA family protein [Psychrosphaera sp.]
MTTKTLGVVQGIAPYTALYIVLVIATLALSGCKTTATKQSNAQTSAQIKTQVQADKMVQVPVADKRIIKAIDKIDSISVQEYQIKKESLFRITFSNKLLFDFARHDSANINLDDIKTFTHLYQQKSLGAYLYVVGHSDSVGSAQTNQSLSARRGYTIANLLVKNGIAPDKIKIVAAGETIPVASNKTKSERAKNRRVEILSSDNRALNLEFFRQFDCSDIDSA